jgi:signal transduction histidine kinase
VAASTLSELAAQAEQKRLALRLTPAPELRPLRSDARLVRLILTNLVDNALKYTERGEVEVTLAYGAGVHRFAVRDTGPGIPGDMQTSIFEPFAHLDPVRHKHTPGLGLGLALV